MRVERRGHGRILGQRWLPCHDPVVAERGIERGAGGREPVRECEDPVARHQIEQRRCGHQARALERQGAEIGEITG
jgi:hypothetical protein